MGTTAGASAAIELRATGTPTRTLVSGSATIGTATSSINFPKSGAAYAVRAIGATAGAVFELTLLTNTAAVDAWTAGSAQARAAYAVGTVTGSGSLNVEFTDAILGTINITVPVLEDDTAEQWGVKVVNALAADTQVAGRYAVSGTSGQVLVTRKPIANLAGEGAATVPIYGAPDVSFDFEIQAGTATISGLPIGSSSFAAGAETEGTLPFDVGEIDFEGVALPEILGVPGLLIEAIEGDWSYTSGTAEKGFLVRGEKRLFIGSLQDVVPIYGNDPWEFIVESAPALIRVVVIGNTIE